MHQKTLKILGFLFNEDRKMDEFIWRGEGNLVRSIRKKQSMLRVIKPYTNPEQLSIIANAVVNSQILYLAPLWSMTTRANIDKIQVAQTKVARQILWSRRTKRQNKPHRQDVINQLSWLNVDQLEKSATIQIVRKSAMNRSTVKINDMFNFKVFN